MYFQLAFPKRITLETTPEGYQRARELIKRYNGSTPIYRTIYNFRGYPSSHTAIIDKLFFDFDYSKDNPNKARDDLIKLHDCLCMKNIKHVNLFSGNGYHLFLFTKSMISSSLKSPSQAIRLAITKLSDELDIQPDLKVVDLMRVARMPGTINIKTGRHCIFLDDDTLLLDRKDLLKFAYNPRENKKQVYGDDLYDLKEYDLELPEYDFEEPDINMDEIDDNFVLKSLPKCLAVSLVRGDPGYNERYAIITAMRDSLITHDVAKQVLRSYLSDDKFRHCVYEERQLDYLYNRKDLLCPSCYTLRAQGLCVENCGGHNIYL